MAEKRQPWMKFYPSDWRADPRLRVCSLAARGLWIEMVALMHEAEPYGHLLINGVPPSVKQLSALVGAPAGKSLEELEISSVFSRGKDGVIFSRRMVRDFEQAIANKANGGRGGNPKLLKQDKGGVNPLVKGGDKAQTPEAREYYEDEKWDGVKRLVPTLGGNQKRKKPQSAADQDMVKHLMHFAGMTWTQANDEVLAARQGDIQKQRDLERISRAKGLGWFAEEAA